MHEVVFASRRYPIYTVEEAVFRGVSFREDWRVAAPGEWVRTDTGHVLEVLATGTAGNTPWIRTACGTYPARAFDELGHEVRENRYTFSGLPPKHSVTKRVELFATAYARLRDPKAAYRFAYPGASSDKYITERSRKLLES